MLTKKLTSNCNRLQPIASSHMSKSKEGAVSSGGLNSKSEVYTAYGA